MNEIFNILIVDDSKSIVHYLLDILEDKNHNLLYTFSKEEAKKIINQNAVDILVCDLMLPKMEDGLDTVRYFKHHNPFSKVLSISAYTEVDNVVTVIKEGADDFVPKSSTKDQIVHKLESLKSLVTRSSEKQFAKENDDRDDELLYRSASMQEVLEKIKIIAENDVESCLIMGESGVGKELVARTIHKMSPRVNEPFIALNSAGMPETLIDSELFGFEKGSFTGAYSSNQGKFELADKGILFLDEISEMPIHLQSKLLRVLERREIMRIGGNKYIPVDVMILAATNRNLEEEIRKGEFREDIFYRLNMVKIEVPPLRERKEDIVFLAKHFLNVVTHRLKKEIVLPENTLKLLENYAFPGNVRELKNIIFSAALFCKDKVILPEVIQSYFKKSASFNNSQNSSNSKGEVDKDTLIASLRHNEGNISETAKELGYSREGLSRKIKRLEIDLESLKVEENS